jgi:hypothetical protein
VILTVQEIVDNGPPARWTAQVQSVAVDVVQPREYAVPATSVTMHSARMPPFGQAEP